MAIYRIYTKVNYAETSRDPDEIVIVELCYKKSLKNALEYANDYISKNMINATKLKKYDNGYKSFEIHSWGRTLTVEKINID